MDSGVGVDLGKPGLGPKAKGWHHFVVVVVKEDVSHCHDGPLVLVGLVWVHKVQGAVVCGGAVGGSEVYSY